MVKENRRSGGGKVVTENWDKLIFLWDGSPSVIRLPFGKKSAEKSGENQENQENQEDDNPSEADDIDAGNEADFDKEEPADKYSSAKSVTAAKN